MAKIDSYPLVESPVSGSDKLIGTDTTNNNATKNFTVNDLAAYISAGSGFVPYTGAEEDLDLGSQNLYTTNGVFYGTVNTANINILGGLLVNSSTGTSGQVLVSQGVGTSPIWANVSTGAQGVQGPVGPQGPIGPTGPSGLTWRGSWASGTSYILNDAVGYSGASWFCILATSGTTAPNLDTSHWALLAAQGAQGPIGATGAQGPTGATGPAGPGGSQTLQQVLDLDHALTNGRNYQGTLAGLSNTGTNVNAFGSGAAQGNIGNNINALGIQAALSNTGYYVNALGADAGTSNGGYHVNAFGSSAAVSNSGFNVNALGRDAGNSNAYSYVNLFGYNASATTNNQTVLAGQNYKARLSYNGLTADRLYTFPDASGTIALESYKSYTIRLGWDGGNWTASTIYQNTLGGAVTLTDFGSGTRLKLTTSGLFTLGKTIVIPTIISNQSLKTGILDGVFPNTVNDLYIRWNDATGNLSAPTPFGTTVVILEVRVYA